MNTLFEVKNGIAYLTLNRPQVLHALNADLMKEITGHIKSCAENKEVRVVVLSGSGDKAFCSGADLKEGLEKGLAPLGDTLRENYNPMILAMRNLEKPIIGKLNGVAAGAGMSLALACDLLVAREDTYLTELFVGIGLMPDAGSMFFLPRIVGMQKAFELCSTGRKVLVPEALQLGLVSKSVPYEQLDVAVDKLADFYAQAPTVAIGKMKKVLNRSLNLSLEEVLEMEAEGQTECGFTNDFGEGVMAFLQKREAKFKGN